jgi:hypothetical protein
VKNCVRLHTVMKTAPPRQLFGSPKQIASVALASEPDRRISESSGGQEDAGIPVRS